MSINILQKLVGVGKVSLRLLLIIMLVFPTSIMYFSTTPVYGQDEQSHIELVGCFDQYGNPQLPCDFSDQGPPQQQQQQQQQLIPSGTPDYNISINPQFASISQGDTTSTMVTVDIVRGNPGFVQLSVTKYYGIGISTVFGKNGLAPNPSDSTTLSIQTDCNTPPDNYLFTVRGDTQGTFQTHVQTFNLHVDANAGCQGNQQNNPSNQPQNNQPVQNPMMTAKADALVQQANSLYQSGQYQQAISFLDMALADDPTNVNALLDYGNILFSLGKYDDAITYYNKVIEINPQDATALDSEGRAYYTEGKYSEAESSFSRAIAVDQNNPVFQDDKNKADAQLGNSHAGGGNTAGGGSVDSSSGGSGVGKGGGGGCLIATAAFGSELTPQVQFLRGFRDNHILATQSGSSFMSVFNAWYYSFSPYVANYERQQPWLQEIVRTSIYPLLGILTISERGFSTVQGDYGAVVAGSIASSMIGAVYFWPFALSVKQVRKTDFNYKFTFFAIAGVSVSVIGSILVGNHYALMITTSSFVLTLLSVSAILVAKLIVKSKNRFSKRLCGS